MCESNERKQTIIYFDFTAGRGSYDDYKEDEYTESIPVESKKSDEINSKTNSNEFHPKFNDFSKIQIKQLPKANFNSIENQRRHSYSRTSRGRAPGGNNCFRQQNQNSNFQVHENKNNCPNVKSILTAETKINRKNDMQSDTPITSEWCPKRINAKN